MPVAIDSRQRILDVAAEQFRSRGYLATSMRDIADEVGIQAGSLYYHFASKEEILTQVFERGIDAMHAAYTEAEQATANGPAIDRIGSHIRAHLAALFEHGPYTAAHVTTFRGAPASVQAEVIPMRDAYEARWAQLFDELVASGALRADIDLRLARLALMGSMNFATEWFHPELGGLDEVAATITQQFFQGVGS